MTPAELAAHPPGPLNHIGTGWMFSLGSYEPGLAAGYSLFDFYIGGRGGVWPEASGMELADEMAIFHPEMVVLAWEQAKAIGPIEHAVALFAAAGADTGRARFDDPTTAEELSSLAGRVVRAADGDGLPLFEGWRRLEPPADPAGAAAHHLNGLRELRGSTHLHALQASGVDAVAALVYRAGPDMAALFGHQPPLPEVTDEVKARWRRAEATTDEQLAPAFAALDDAERVRFAELVDSLLS
jgi:hypothetical protein